MKKVLVTGGAGYIGSVLVRLLINKGFYVVVVDSLKFGGQALFEIINHPQLEFHKLDIRDYKAMENIVKNCNYVCHLAAIVGDPACKKYKTEAEEVNDIASVKLLEMASSAGIEKFIFCSTCSNYGKMETPDSYVDETSALRPVSLYAELKVKFEQTVFDATNKVNSTVLRFATVYGHSPRQRFDLTVNEFTRDAILKKELNIFGEQFWRPYCHVHDLANSVVTVLLHDAASTNKQVYNVGNTDENYTKKMIVEEIAKAGIPFDVKYTQQIDDPRDYRVKFEKIARDLNFTTTKKVIDGIMEIKKLVESNVVEDYYDTAFGNT